MYNPNHEKVYCRRQCGIATRSATGLCAACRDKVAALWYDIRLAEEVAAHEKLTMKDIDDEI